MAWCNRYKQRNALKKKEMSKELMPVSGGCNPVNWVSHTWRNLTTVYLNLNFVSIARLILLYSFYAEKVFISCVWLILVS